MKDLISHVLKENYEECRSKSLINCHTKGLHSIMLIDKPEQRIRLFVTDSTHDLWKNSTINNKMSIAIHPHHCNLTIIQLDGVIDNLNYKLSETKGTSVITYLWKSGVLNEDGKFIKCYSANDKLLTISKETLYPGDKKYLKANDLHTVYVDKKAIASWIIIEGKEDINYQPYAYSLNNLEKFKSNGLYKKPTKKEFDKIINLLNI